MSKRKKARGELAAFSDATPECFTCSRLRSACGLKGGFAALLRGLGLRRSERRDVMRCGAVSRSQAAHPRR